MRKWFPLFLLVLLCGPPVAAASQQTVLVVGDSLGAAYGINASDGWVALLDERMKERGLPYRAVNASISGDTTQGGLARLPRALRVHEPAVVVIGLGGNDGLRGYPVERMQANLERMIVLAREAGARVMLIGVTIPPNYGDAYRRRFTEVYDALADRHDVPLATFAIEDVVARDGMLQADGIHPTAAAQPWMLDLVWERLAPLLTAH